MPLNQSHANDNNLVMQLCKLLAFALNNLGGRVITCHTLTGTNKQPPTALLYRDINLKVEPFSSSVISITDVGNNLEISTFIISAIYKEITSIDVTPNVLTLGQCNRHPPLSIGGEWKT